MDCSTDTVKKSLITKNTTTTTSPLPVELPEGLSAERRAVAVGGVQVRAQALHLCPQAALAAAARRRFLLGRGRALVLCCRKEIKTWRISCWHWQFHFVWTLHEIQTNNSNTAHTQIQHQCTHSCPPCCSFWTIRPPCLRPRRPRHPNRRCRRSVQFSGVKEMSYGCEKRRMHASSYTCATHQTKTDHTV